MSTYDDASLVMIPSGYKTGTVFSQKPMSTDGQLTFTRSNDTATRVASNGLIEKVRTNTLLHSQAFENAVYNKGTGGSISADSVLAPDGTMTADAYTWATATATYAYLAQSVAGTSQIPNTFSIYIKRPAGSGSRTLRLAVTDVTISTAFSSNFTITESWQRFEFSRTSASTTGNVGIGLMTGSTGVSIAGGEVLDVWGAQLETGDIATDYIPTTTAAVSVGPVANVPRLDYLGSSCPRLLLEPQRQNVITFSEQMDNAAWTKTNATITANQTTSPSGYVDADKLIPSSGLQGILQQNHLITATQANTMSIFAKAGELNLITLANRDNASASNAAIVEFDLSTGVISTAASASGVYSAASGTITNYGNGWYRLTLTFISSASVTNRVRLFTDFSGDGTKGFFVWGCQFETNASYPSSYVNTLAASVTRGADACSKTGISSLIGQSEGTIFLQFNNRLLASYPNEYIVQIISGTTQLWVRKESGDNTYTIRLIVSGVTIWTFASVSIPNGNVKLAASYKTGDSAIYLNGAQVSTTNTAAFSGSAFSDLNFNFGGTLNPELPLSQALLFKTRLPNSELASLTTL